MSWNLFSQYLDIFLTLILVVRILRLRLGGKYLACIIFIVYGSVESIIYLIGHALISRGVRIIDYRIMWFCMESVAWITTIWVVYSLLIAILRNLPGILRFSLRFLNAVFTISLGIALVTLRPEYAASGIGDSKDWLYRLNVSTRVVDRALSLAELLSIVCVLVFVLRFPIRVPRNLAAFCAGFSVYLFSVIGLFLMRTYVPAVWEVAGIQSVPSYVIACCLLYWIFLINATGEQAVVTLGRQWQTVPQARLIEQLEAMNTALLQSRKQA